MITYKNIGCSTKTFYGVTFNPGDIKEVPGYINSQGMARIFNKSSDITLAKLPKKRNYNRKLAAVESEPVDSASIEINIVKTNKEELPDG
jgi:hypothetical protein